MKTRRIGRPAPLDQHETERLEPAEPVVAGAHRASRPQRPSLRSDNPPPVLVKVPPPFTVRLCQLLWALSLVVGGVAVVYFFVTRKDHLPAIMAAVRRVNASRPEAVYANAADIVFWSAFGVAVVLILIQVTLLVSFMSRKPGTRWWQFATLLAQAGSYAVFLDVVGTGEIGEQLRNLLIGQSSLVLLALLAGVLPPAVTWSARRHDVRRGLVGAGTTDL